MNTLSAKKGDAKCDSIAMQEAVTTGSDAVVSQAISLVVPQSETREQSKTESELLIHQSSNQSCSKPVEKPNCYRCRFRKELSGDAHSACGSYAADPIALLIFATGKSEFMTSKIHVRGNTHGVRSGWFMWPLNFDPTWLEICTGYMPKLEDATPQSELNESNEQKG